MINIFFNPENKNQRKNESLIYISNYSNILHSLTEKDDERKRWKIHKN